jgi:hypothetical protein
MINHQRRDQEYLVKCLGEGTSTGEKNCIITDLIKIIELTNEIRGERLRFVDAMKEATSINVEGMAEQSFPSTSTLTQIIRTIETVQDSAGPRSF